MNKRLIEKAKKKILSSIFDYGDDPWNLKIHIKEAEKWAGRILNMYPKADKEVVMLSIWLHDIGHYPIPKEDHAIISERIAKEFFITEKANAELSNQVLHCIRSHRNCDVKPQTFEAKLFAMIDSVSHFTYAPYMEMAQDGRMEQAIGKLERDFRDIKPFPEVLKMVTPIYQALKNLLLELEKLDL
jgi:23S rRNA maturation-related 3'-5' exoribonuclease YhaM